MRLEIRLKRIHSNWIAHLIGLIAQNIRDRIRLMNPEARLEGYDKKYDLLVVLATLKLIGPIMFEDNPFRLMDQDITDYLNKYPEFKEQRSKFERTNTELKKVYSSRKLEYLQNKKEVDDLTEKAQKDGNIMKLVELSHLVKHCYYGRIKMLTNETDYFLEQAHKINPKVLPLESKDLPTIRRSVKTDIRKVRGIISDRNTFKISLSLKNAGTIIPVVSSVFLISGYLYNRFLLGEFGIEVSKYFTLSDYMASSIESIRYSASGALLAGISFFIGVHSASRRSLDQLEYERKKTRYLPAFLILTSVVSAVFAYINNLELFYDACYMFIFFSAIQFAPWLSHRYFKEPMVALFIIVFLCTFAGHMFVSVGKTIYNLKYKKLEEIKKDDIIFKEQMPLQSSKVALFAANSNFLFLLDEDKNAFIVPKDQILYVIKKASRK